MMLIRTDRGLESPSKFLATLPVTEGLKVCKDLIKNNFMNCEKSEVEACIITEMKDRFHLKGEEVRNLRQFYKEAKAVKIPDEVPSLVLKVEVPYDVSYSRFK